MRSVDRGPWPNENDRRRTSFFQIRARQGPANRRESVSIAVIASVPAISMWSTSFQNRSHANLKRSGLISCLDALNCNSRKWDRNNSRLGFMWPDSDDTFGAFLYRSGGRVSVNDRLAQGEHGKASALFGLVGLGGLGTRTDRRRHKRHQAWEQAVKVRSLINDDNSQSLAVDVALGTGFFSVWMAVFHDDEDMRQRLVDAFPGTRTR